jgi:hypothetical protein
MLRLAVFSPLLFSVCLVTTPEFVPAPAAPETLTGRWRADIRESKPDRIYFELRRDDEDGRHHMGTTLSRSAFTGLPSNLSNTGVIKFELRRDAGLTAFEGEFRDNWGTGRFTFTPDATFAADLQKRGERDTDTERLFAFALHDVDRQFIADIEKLGYKNLDGDQLLAFRIHGVSPEFITAMRKLGYEDLSADDLVAFRIHGVSPEFVAGMRQAGFTHLDADKLVAFRIHGVNAEAIAEFKNSRGDARVRQVPRRPWLQPHRLRRSRCHAHPRCLPPVHQRAAVAWILERPGGHPGVDAYPPRGPRFHPRGSRRRLYEHEPGGSDRLLHPRPSVDGEAEAVGADPVFNVTGGMTAWRQVGLPEKGSDQGS